MDYRSKRSALSAATWLGAAAAYSALTLYVNRGYGVGGGAAIAMALFLAVFIARRGLYRRLDDAAYRRAFAHGPTKLLSRFTERVRTCFTMPEFIAAIRDDLEKALDASVVLIKSNTWDLVYASPSNLSSDPGLLPALRKSFGALSDGIGFMDERLALTVNPKTARGFFILARGYYFFVFSRSTVEVDPDAFRVMHAEIIIFFDRVLTVARLFQIAALSKEWRLIAETQRAFLPAKLPEHPKLSLAAYFRPLVNVSGDFYDAIKVDDDAVLLVMGDVSGKGLAAGLIMGIALNTIRASADKRDLPGLTLKVDAAIREMGFDDKYTVLFLGLADLKAAKLSYVSAAMPDQFMVVRTVRGPIIKRLESNNGIVGLVPMDRVAVDQVELRSEDVIVLSTDGLTELEGDEGVPLEQAPEFQRLLAESNDLAADDLAERLATLGESYVGAAALRDDITILTAKAGRLWD